MLDGQVLNGTIDRCHAPNMSRVLELVGSSSSVLATYKGRLWRVLLI